MHRIVATLTLSAVLSFPVIAVAADQPNMEEALHALEAAKQHLIAADEHRDHGGHAEAATKLVEDAIREVREGIRFRNEHGR